jgi:hypothetical protein
MDDSDECYDSRASKTNTTYCTNATIYSFLERCDVDLSISLICSLLSKHA